MSDVPTVKIKHPTSASGFAVINAKDFDPKRHERFSPGGVPPAPPAPPVPPVVEVVPDPVPVEAAPIVEAVPAPSFDRKKKGSR